jgi:hypothetical protein
MRRSWLLVLSLSFVGLCAESARASITPSADPHALPEMTFRDSVGEIFERDGRLAVSFAAHAAVYKVSLQIATAGLRRVLEDSRATGRQLEIRVDPATKEILSVDPG